MERWKTVVILLLLICLAQLYIILTLVNMCEERVSRIKKTSEVEILFFSCKELSICQQQRKELQEAVKLFGDKVKIKEMNVSINPIVYPDNDETVLLRNKYCVDSPPAIVMNGYLITLGYLADKDFLISQICNRLKKPPKFCENYSYVQPPYPWIPYIFYQKSEKEIIETERGFKETDEKICNSSDGRIIVRFFCTTQYEICRKEEIILKELEKEGFNEYFEFRYLNFDVTNVSEKDRMYYLKYNPDAILPSIIIGCRYYKNGISSKDEIKNILCKLITNEEIC